MRLFKTAHDECAEGTPAARGSSALFEVTRPQVEDLFP